jgi:two-component system, chemotaxis family, chemotaxis protein CheY
MARILAVDDSAAMRQMVGITLQGAGHQVEQAIDGCQALEIAEKQKFDLVITDVNMPNMDGITLVRELRNRASYKYVPLLVLTTEATTERKQQGKAAGASTPRGCWRRSPKCSAEFSFFSPSPTI